jgi:SAM-dependent methyltransferase
MSYGPETARHYEAYRPPLHSKILERALPEGQQFESALDIGCGVGHSSTALWEHAVHVTGQEINMSMMREAEHHTSGNLHFTNRSLDELIEEYRGEFDLITFAGSLFYQDPAKVWSQLQVLAAAQVHICVYDFDVQLSSVFESLGLIMPEGDYNHRINFDGQDLKGYESSGLREFTLSFQCTAKELAHLLFSVDEWHDLFVPNEFEEFVKLIVSSIGTTTELKANCFYTVYSKY